jgi:hypothetical protein
VPSDERPTMTTLLSASTGKPTPIVGIPTKKIDGS